MPHGSCLQRIGFCARGRDLFVGFVLVLQTVVFMAAACEGFMTSASLGNFATGAIAERTGSLSLRERGGGFAGLGLCRPKKAVQPEPAASLSMSSNEQRWERPAARGEKDVIIGTRVNTNTHVQGKHDKGYGIGEFMRLPPEQYVLIPLPNNAKLERIGGSLFRLNVCSPLFHLPQYFGSLDLRLPCHQSFCIAVHLLRVRIDMFHDHACIL